MIGIYRKSRTHLSTAGESYWEHFAFAMGFAFRLFTAALAVFIHALIPSLFEFTGSKTICALHENLQRRHLKPEK